MRLFKEVAIIGPGLIGGSMALALKKKKLASRIIGVSRHQRTIALARRIRAIDQGSRDIRIVKNADLIILATPVDAILKLADVLKGIIKKNAIVIDVGSSKEKIVAKLQKQFPCYVGTHPLAGSQNQGILSARPDMFEGSLCILTPTAKTPSGVLGKIIRFWQALGAKTVLLSPQQHDKIIAMVSHLPHSASFALMSTIPKNYLSYDTSSLRDTTRIAGSDSALWAGILLSNRKNMLEAIGAFQKNLGRIKSAINKRDRKALIKILKNAKEKRDFLK